MRAEKNSGSLHHSNTSFATALRFMSFVHVMFGFCMVYRKDCQRCCKRFVCSSEDHHIVDKAMLVDPFVFACNQADCYIKEVIFRLVPACYKM